MLAQARDWLARHRDDLSPQERGYVEVSLALRQREEAEREAARQAEIQRPREMAEAARNLAREQGRRAKIAVVGVIVALLLAAFAGWKTLEANTAKGRADEAATQARIQRKADTEATSADDVEHAGALALESLYRARESKRPAAMRRTRARPRPPWARF
jgi:hypothetical protein